VCVCVHAACVNTTGGGIVEVNSGGGDTPR